MPILLNNRYEVIQTLSSGGFGETFLAKDTYMPSERFCVVKQLKPVEKSHEIYQLIQERFQREAAILEALGGNCNQIPALYAYFCDEDQFYLVQEWIEGDTLTEKLQKKGKFTEQEVRQILINILPILDYIHSQHIIHRDIKPDNIIIREHDSKPVLIDFGAVRESMTTVLNTQGNPTSSIVIGTPGFMSSEQAAGRPIYSSDLYSLGLTIVYLLTGQKPQKLETDSQTGEVLWQHLLTNLSPSMRKVISKSIAYHPRDRYPTATAMLDDLQGSDSLSLLTEPPSIITTLISQIPSSVISYSKSLKLNTRQTIFLGSLMVGGLIGISIIISQLIKTSYNSITKTEISVSTTRTTTPLITNTPDILVTPQSTDPNANGNPNILPTTPLNETNVNPQSVNSSPNVEVSPENRTSVNNYVWLSQRPITDLDLGGKTAYELDIMKNSIYAVYGRRFEDPELQNYFDKQSWYIPLYSPQEFPMQLLSQLELANIEYIDQYQERYQLRHFQK